jgi:hypothetical protein
MKKTLLAVTTSLILMILTACAPVQFYSDKSLKEKTGLKFYTVKPYLHIERDYENGRIVKSTILYLPDLANPQYMVVRDGLNSKKVNLKLTNGCIDTYGYSSTGKIDESVDALGALISKGTDAVTELKTLTGQDKIKTSSNTVELYEIVFGQDKTTLRKVDVGQ